MLIEFKFKNFLSFRDETVFSMVASSDKTFLENSFPVSGFGKRRLLRSAVIYGPNAAGKTNFIRALGFLADFVIKSTERKINTPINIKPFLLTSDDKQSPSEFEITYLDDEMIRYWYGFHATSARITREWLVVYPKGLPQTWFEREDAGEEDSKPSWYFGRFLKGINKQVAGMTRQDVLFLSNAARLNHDQLGKVFEWFQKSLQVINANDLLPEFLPYSASRAKEDRHLHDDIYHLLETADIGISGFDVRDKTNNGKTIRETILSELYRALDEKKHLEVFMHHTIGEGKEISFPIESESIGTQRLFALSAPLADILDNGGILLMDELDTSLHPLLVRYLVELFHNPRTNPKGAQLIFNTHDTTLLDGCLFRRDQIWFVEKDRQGCSHLYPLLDFSPRKDEALAKGYLMGRYGAIPFLSEPRWSKETDHGET